MNRYSYMVRENREKRDDGDDDCFWFEKGEKLPDAHCDTDGHYKCDYCIHNIKQDKKYYEAAKRSGIYT